MLKPSALKNLGSVTSVNNMVIYPSTVTLSSLSKLEPHFHQDVVKEGVEEEEGVEEGVVVGVGELDRKLPQLSQIL